jgi:hypothetical protein
MNLKKNNEVIITAWYNTELICNQNWQVFSQENGDNFFIIAKDPMTNNELKFKIEKSSKSL